MKKSMVKGICILSIFILCSITYQPIIADESIEQIGQIKDSKVYKKNNDGLKELYNRLIEIKLNDDCGCSSDSEGWNFIILCAIFIWLKELILVISPYSILITILNTYIAIFGCS
jgi:hypothetical protein